MVTYDTQPIFSVGYSGSKEDLELILSASARIGSVYTGGLAGKIAGGRPQYLDSLNVLREQIAAAHKHKVKFEIALNAPCGIQSKSNRAWWQDIRDYLIELESCGTDSIIASHPFLIEFTKKNTNMQVIASTICEVDNVRSALFYEQMGSDVIIPSMNVNYDLKELETMAKKLQKATLRIMLNEHCLGNCPWRRFHHNHYAHSNEEFDYHQKCKMTFLENPFLLISNNVIRPEDLTNYSHITREYKIVGRLVPIDDLVARIKAYDLGEFEGNYVFLSDSQLAKKFTIDNKKLGALFHHKSTCSKVCQDCRFCIEIADKHVKLMN